MQSNGKFKSINTIKCDKGFLRVSLCRQLNFELVPNDYDKLMYAHII